MSPRNVKNNDYAQTADGQWWRLVCLSCKRIINRMFNGTVYCTECTNYELDKVGARWGWQEIPAPHWGE